MSECSDCLLNTIGLSVLLSSYLPKFWLMFGHQVAHGVVDLALEVLSRFWRRILASWWWKPTERSTKGSGEAQ